MRMRKPQIAATMAVLIIATGVVLAGLHGISWDVKRPDTQAVTAGTGAGAGKTIREGHARDAFNWWYGTRAYPNDLIPKAAWYRAFEYSRATLAPDAWLRDVDPSWASIGPDNFAGRMLALAIDPRDPAVIWAGAASGGLWKTTTGGDGAAAWAWVNTGFPLLAVSAIVIDSRDPQVMYLGTGEMEKYHLGVVGTPGARATYGLGVIKSTDGGVTWIETGLTWTFDQSRAVFALKLDPVDSQILWCATSEGLYKTTDAGATWTNSHPSLMAIDVVIDPNDHRRVWVSHGQLNSTVDPGIYRSTDGGATWVRLGGGLPATNFGRTPLALSGSDTIYAGVSHAMSGEAIGLFRSTDGGDTWTCQSTLNWVGNQGWYDNVVAVHPANGNIVYCGGLNWFRSTSGGSNLARVFYEAHVDQHALAFDPGDPLAVTIGSDGGVWRSTDGGDHSAGKNGGLVTTQFYAGFAGASPTIALAVGGLQDQGTLRYTGSTSWSRISGGDGGWCAIDPTDENVLYKEYVFLNIYRSDDGANSWTEIHPMDTQANFIAPYVLSEMNPNVLYAGTRSVKKSTNRGRNWSYPDGSSNWNGTPVAVIGVAHTSADTLCAATGSMAVGSTVEVRRSTNGGVTWTNVTAGLPNRYPTDIEYERGNGRNVWLTFSGYGTSHVFRSTDAGLTWTDRSGNLPDIPVQAVVIDPYSSDWAYVGTDLGVYRSFDGGFTWTELRAGMPPAMVLDLTIRPENRLMRAATYGNGVYELYLSEPAAVEDAITAAGNGFRLELPGPNPTRGEATLRYALTRAGRVRIAVYDAAGRLVRLLAEGERPAGEGQIVWDGRDGDGRRVPHGVYFARLQAPGAGVARSRKITVVK